MLELETYFYVIEDVYLCSRLQKVSLSTPWVIWFECFFPAVMVIKSQEILTLCVYILCSVCVCVCNILINKYCWGHCVQDTVPGDRDNRGEEEQVLILIELIQEEIDNKYFKKIFTGCDHWYQGNKQGDVMESIWRWRSFSQDVIGAEVWEMRMNYLNRRKIFLIEV